MCIEAQDYHFQHLLYSNLKHIIVNCCLFIYCYYSMYLFTHIGRIYLFLLICWSIVHFFKSIVKCQNSLKDQAVLKLVY
jgi:hypothetical protein